MVSDGKYSKQKLAVYVSLHRLADTRWSSRLDALKPIAKQPREIRESLENLRQELSLPAVAYAETEGLINYFGSFKAIVQASFWYKCLKIINS